MASLLCDSNPRSYEAQAATTPDALSSVQSLSRVRLLATPWTAVFQASLSITNSQCLLKLMPIESVMLQGQGLWVQQTWVWLGAADMGMA